MESKLQKRDIVYAYMNGIYNPIVEMEVYRFTINTNGNNTNIKYFYYLNGKNGDKYCCVELTCGNIYSYKYYKDKSIPGSIVSFTPYKVIIDPTNGISYEGLTTTRPAPKLERGTLVYVWDNYRIIKIDNVKEGCRHEIRVPADVHVRFVHSQPSEGLLRCYGAQLTEFDGDDDTTCWKYYSTTNPLLLVPEVCKAIKEGTPYELKNTF
jgi:hypothetical protein